MSTSQPGILPPCPSHSRYLEFSTVNDLDPADGLRNLAARTVDEEIVVGIGPGLIARLKQSVDGLRPFPALSGPGCDVPSTQADIWCWLRGTDRGDITHTGRAISQALGDSYRCDRLVDGFFYGDGRDLSGYVDGTENPEGDDAVEAALVDGAGAGLDGSSFVAAQQWQHDLSHLKAMPQTEQDDIIGRRLSNNEEFDEAPPSAHVKRTAQESFDPEAFIVRRSMPWADASGEGLMFVAFGKTLDSYEVQMRRMVGEEDGITDGLFRFSRPISGSYFWCPPVANGKLDLSAIGL